MTEILDSLTALLGSVGTTLGPYATVHLVLVNWLLNQLAKGLWDWGAALLARVLGATAETAARLQNLLTLLFVWLGGLLIVWQAPGLPPTLRSWIYGTVVAALTWIAHAQVLQRFELRLFPWLRNGTVGLLLFLTGCTTALPPPSVFVVLPTAQACASQQTPGAQITQCAQGWTVLRLPASQAP